MCLQFEMEMAVARLLGWVKRAPAWSNGLPMTPFSTAAFFNSNIWTGINVQDDTTPYNHLEKTKTQPMDQVGKAGRGTKDKGRDDDV